MAYVSTNVAEAAAGMGTAMASGAGYARDSGVLGAIGPYQGYAAAAGYGQIIYPTGPGGPSGRPPVDPPPAPSVAGRMGRPRPRGFAPIPFTGLGAAMASGAGYAQDSGVLGAIPEYSSVIYPTVPPLPKCATAADRAYMERCMVQAFGGRAPIKNSICDWVQKNDAFAEALNNVPPCPPAAPPQVTPVKAAPTATTDVQKTVLIGVAAVTVLGVVVYVATRK